jgi:hypothetical protein
MWESKDSLSNLSVPADTWWSFENEFYERLKHEGRKVVGSADTPLL